MKKVCKKDIGITSAFNRELQSVTSELRALRGLVIGYQVVSFVRAISWNRGAGGIEACDFISISFPLYAKDIDEAIAIFVGIRDKFSSGFDFWSSIIFLKSLANLQSFKNSPKVNN